MIILLLKLTRIKLLVKVSFKLFGVSSVSLALFAMCPVTR